MKKATPTLECPSCEGKGRIPLPEHLAVLLPILRRNPGATTEKVKSSLGEDITMNGISNRLSDLVGLGLVTRTREGKWFRYTIAK
jgi:predicted transcriptional regulator